MILALAHVRHIVGLLVQELPVKELLNNEGAFRIEIGPLRRRRFGVEAESFTLAHGVNELLADVFADISIRLTS